MALADAGMLASYVSGQLNDRQIQNLPGPFRQLVPGAVVRNSIPYLGANLNLSRPLGTAMGYMTRRLSILDIQEFGEWGSGVLFDFELARTLSRLRPKVVVGYEMACLRTFLQAKQLGVACVLDAAACHHRLQDMQLLRSESKRTRWGRLIRERKDKEAALADLLICPSDLSANSYVGSGLPASKIVVNPLGVSLETFSRTTADKRAGPIRFVFVANAEYVKGADLVAASIEALQHRGVPAYLDVVGGAKVDVSPTGSVRLTHHGHVSHESLARIFRQADCLLAPSRLESFGMVVLEAMAMGIPAVVSDWTGAVALVENGVNGWRFGQSVEAFTDRVRWCSENVESVRALRPNCIATARRNTWDAYKQRSVQIMRSAISG